MEPTRRPPLGLPGWNERAAVALLVLVAGHLLAAEPTAGPLTPDRLARVVVDPFFRLDLTRRRQGQPRSLPIGPVRPLIAWVRQWVQPGLSLGSTRGSRPNAWPARAKRRGRKGEHSVTGA